MNVMFFEEFISYIEELSKSCDEKDYVQDGCGAYLKGAYLSDLVTQARELIKYNECEIAFENMLDNLAEASIVFDDKIISLAREAFGKKINAESEQRLYNITKNR